jgi:hypothetical protein
MSVIALCLITAIVYAILDSVRKSRENKMSEEIRDIIYDEFLLKEVKYIQKLSKDQNMALLRIKAIFDHLGVKVEIVDDKITPSIDTFRSISFVKKYLPEIDEQVRIYKDAETEMNKIDVDHKNKYVIFRVHQIVSLSKWRKLSDEQKKEIIHNISENYDYQRKQYENNQWNLNE